MIVPLIMNVTLYNYYLLNTNKYFTSNTQLHFLQRNFYINDDIVIDSLHNFSLASSGVNNTLIECSTPSLRTVIMAIMAIKEGVEHSIKVLFTPLPTSEKLCKLSITMSLLMENFPAENVVEYLM